MASNQQPPERREQEKLWPVPPDGLRLALWLDGQGGGAPIDWYTGERWSRGEGVLWIQIDPRHEQAMAQLRESELLAADELQILLDSPPRATVRAVGSRGLVLSARGFGPEGEIVSGPAGIARLWLGPNLALALQGYDVGGTEELRRLFRERRGPRDAPELLVWVTQSLGDRFYDFAAELEARMAAIEAGQPLRAGALQRVQTHVLQLHRHLAPHKVMTSRIVSLGGSPFIRPHLELWRDVSDQDADTDQRLRSLQQRSVAVHHYATEELARRSNAAALLLALVSTISLPLTLVVAVLSMDVAIPNSYPWLTSVPAALSILAVMVVFVGLAALVIRRCAPFGRRAFDAGGRGPRVGRVVDTAASQRRPATSKWRRAESAGRSRSP